MTSKESIKSLRELPNIGQKMAEKVVLVGITSKEEFLRRDPYEVFDELLNKVDPTLCRCALASIVGAHDGFPWHKITKETAIEFQKRYPEHSWGKC
jgi:hypothetical protein